MDRYENKLNALSQLFQIDLFSPSQNVLKSSTNDLEEYKDSLLSSNVLNDSNDTRNPNSVSIAQGQGIRNNHGCQLASITKTPNYKTEHETLLSGGQMSLDNKKTMLGGGLEAPSGATNLASLNNKLVQLPLARTLEVAGRRTFNGLPFYSKAFVEKHLGTLDSSKLADLEYIHGATICNQFLNDKRVIREYQWRDYYKSRMGGKGLRSTLPPDLDKKMSVEVLKMDGDGGQFRENGRFSELLIEQEVPADETPLMAYSADMDENGSVRTKILKKRRRPNPNALGHSNIRKKKLCY